MVSVDKKTKIFPAPKNEAAVKKEAAAQKKDEGQPKDKSASGADLSKAEDGEKAADSLSLLKSYPDVLVMQPGQDGHANDLSEPLDSPFYGYIRV